MKGRFPIFVLLACVAGLGLGLVHLFRLRFEEGDVYPPYSSLRTDPLGTMGLYESLGQLPGITVRRDFSSATRLPEGRDTTYLHLGARRLEWRWLPESAFREVQRFVADGGRLVIAFHPVSRSERARFGEPETADEAEKKKKPENDDSKEKPEERTRRELEEELQEKLVVLGDVWKLTLRIDPLEEGLDGAFDPVRVERRADLPLPAELDWHSGIVCDVDSPDWQVVYARGSQAVVLERRFGRGSIVIATDSYLLSNQALVEDRQSEFLSWLIGPARTVVFDEAHFGVMENPGVVALMRRYRLYWLLGAMGVIVVLFIWKNSTSLVPVGSGGEEAKAILGKDSAGGMIHLLRRSIPPGRVLPAAFEEWKKTAAQSGLYSAARLAQAEALFESERTAFERDPVGTYRRLHEILETHFHTGSKPPSTS